MTLRASSTGPMISLNSHKEVKPDTVSVYDVELGTQKSQPGLSREHIVFGQEGAGLQHCDWMVLPCLLGYCLL